MIDDRRHFSRIPFHSTAHIYINGELYLNCPVIDVSLKGVLIEKPKHWSGQIGDQYTLDLLLDDAQIVIKMTVTVAHQDTYHLGLECQTIDVDSMTHLKRLLELNLGNSELVHRELCALIH